MSNKNITGLSKQTRVQAENNKARYYSELAEGYKNQTGSYATAAATSAATASVLASTTQAAARSAITSIGTATTDGIGSVTAATTSAISSVQAVGTSVLSVTTSATEAIKTSIVSETTTVIANMATAATGSVNSAATSALNTISGAKTEAASTIGTLTTNAVTVINATKTNYIAEMTTIKNQTTQAKNEAFIWAEGSDEEAQAIGGTHSAKEWCRYNSSVNQNDVRALEGGISSGEVYVKNDSDSIDSRFNEVKQLAHSTFDVSKFTKVGSPVITDDGIVSGFSARANYLYVPLDLSTANTFDIEFECTCGNTTGTIIPFDYGTDYQSTWGSSLLRLQQTGSQRYFVMSGTATYNHFETMIEGHTYKFNIHYDKATTTATIKQYENGQLIFSSGPLNRSAIAQSGYLIIGGSLNANSSWSGSINLRTLFVKIDGEEVFSGNRTGIDTIKPDDYTVVGTPVISADGVASGFSATSVIQPNYSFNNASTANSWEIYIKLKTGSIVSDSQNIFANTSSNYTNFRLLYSKLRMEIGGGSSFLFSLLGTTTLQANTVYYVKFVFTGTKYQIWLSTDGITYTLDNEGNSTDKFASQGTWCIGSSYNMSQYAFPFLGTIDLNEFKIYVDGNLVYQPCLKIPYTWSKTGSKIVASIYRDRVNDMASQFGFAPYYTLSDTDFTLPQVELYGLIGAKTLRDSYENGINKWYLYSNRDLEQQGSCTSGVEVTLPKPFADTNYILTVPYSAKSATAFTPTQTGDWYAKGKGIL